MRKKAVKAMLGLCMAVTVISSSVPCFAEDAAQAETQMDLKLYRKKPWKNLKVISSKDPLSFQIMDMKRALSPKLAG